MSIDRSREADLMTFSAGPRFHPAELTTVVLRHPADTCIRPSPAFWTYFDFTTSIDAILPFFFMSVSKCSVTLRGTLSNPLTVTSGGLQ